jgi:hypothetical protein
MESMDAIHRSAEELQAALDLLRHSPKEAGTLELIVRRPKTGVREVLTLGQLDVIGGLVGDNWGTRGSSRTEDGVAHPDMQLNVMNARVVQLVAGPRDRWPLAGDQLFVDLDLSVANVPAGTRIGIGVAVIEVTSQPHTGCQKFVKRFGLDAMKFVNSPVGRELRLRGLNAKVVVPGPVRVGDSVRKLAPAG